MPTLRPLRPEYVGDTSCLRDRYVLPCVNYHGGLLLHELTRNKAGITDHLVTLLLYDEVYCVGVNVSQ